MSRAVKLGAFTITAIGRAEGVEGETSSGVASRGRGRLFDVRDGTAVHLTVRDTTWQNGERDIVATERHGSPQRFDTLIERLRLPVTARDADLYVELRQVRLKPNGHGNLFSATETELDDGAGISVARELVRLGAIRVGTREDLLGDDGRSRNRWGVRFPQEADLVPVVAYVCTRVGPVCIGLQA
jgi:hypothetical protein